MKNKTERTCKICGNDFFAVSAKVCSKKCSSTFTKKKNIEIGKYQYKCKNCGKNFNASRKRNCNGKPYLFCSRYCANRSRADKLLLTPIVDYRGYVLVGCKNHPNAHDGRVKEHRLVMEKAIGRYLNESEIVHHIDGDRQNNELSNLMITNHQNHSSCTSKHRERYKVSENFIRSLGKWKEYLIYIAN